MKIKKLIIAITGVALVFASCKKEEQIVNPKINPGIKNNISQLFKTNEDLLTQSFTVDASSYQYITTPTGASLTFAPNSFTTKSGQAVTGNVTIKLIEIYDKARMVLLNKPTNGKMSNGKISTLISAGEMKVTAHQAGQELKLKSGSTFSVRVPSSITGGYDAGMQLFDGEINNQDLVWEKVADTVVPKADTLGLSYSWSDSSFGWTNIDKFISDPRPKTTIHVTVPAGYDKSNCAIFLAYKGENGLASFDVYDNATKKFTEHYGQIPIGLEVHFIFITEDNGQIKSEIHSTTIVANHVEAITNPQIISKSQLTTDILALP